LEEVWRAELRREEGRCGPSSEREGGIREVDKGYVDEGKLG
jgi:hypothetical protein